MKYYKSKRTNAFDLSQQEWWYFLFIKEIPYPLGGADKDVNWWLGICFSPTYAGCIIQSNPDQWEECTEEEYIEAAQEYSADRIEKVHGKSDKLPQAKAGSSKK